MVWVISRIATKTWRLGLPAGGAVEGMASAGSGKKRPKRTGRCQSQPGGDELRDGVQWM